jgi:hypothetical protein
MQTIEDGMIKECLICHLKKGNVQGVAENSSMLVARRQQRMIIDASMLIRSLCIRHTPQHF